MHQQNALLAYPNLLLSAALLSCATGAATGGDCPDFEDFAQGFLGSPVHALTVYSGDLVAGGTFSSDPALTVLLKNIARWDGEAWQPFVMDGFAGVQDTVHALLDHDGDLIAGGDFTTAGSVSANRIARWDGTAWHPFIDDEVNGMPGTAGVRALIEYDGDLIAAGIFPIAGNTVANNIARWDGNAWHPLEMNGVAGTNGFVSSLVVHEGNLFVGGSFTTAGGIVVNRIARWDGKSWHPFVANDHTGLPHPVFGLTVFEDQLVVAGQFGAAGGDNFIGGIARWDGSASVWASFNGGFNLTTDEVTVHNGDLIAGGFFTTSWDGAQQFNRVARWRPDATAWEPFEAGESIGIAPFGTVRAFASFDDSLVVAGNFSTIDGQPVNHIARFNDCPEASTGDLNGDGVVDGADLGILLNNWGGSGVGDLNGDGVVDGADLGILLNNWG